MKFLDSNKEKIRKELLQKRKNLSTYEVLKRSNEIIKNLENLREFKEAEKIACYISFNNEVFTHGLIKKYIKEKKILVPVVNKERKEIELSLLADWKDLSQGAYGILEPREKLIVNDADIIIVPGIAFDKRGNRIGYGEGYYDRLLSKLKAIKIALAYDFQVLEKLPEEEHDIKMDMIVTEKGYYNIMGSSAKNFFSKNAGSI